MLVPRVLLGQTDDTLKIAGRFDAGTSSKRWSRRDMLRMAGACCVGAGLGYAVAIEPRWLEITRHDVPVANLPDALVGFRIAQLSDLHLTGFGSLHEQVLEALREADPQLIALTGDVIEDPGGVHLVRELVSALAAPGRDVLATLGNWEHWGEVPLDELRVAYQASGARLLGNESLLLKSGIGVVGTDDFCSGYADLRLALDRPPEGLVRLLLTHAPGLLDLLPADAPRFDLSLAGHTHGGQVCAAGASVWTPPGSGKYVAGQYATRAGTSYVSRGLGTSVFPARFTCRPELPIFRLIRA